MLIAMLSGSVLRVYGVRSQQYLHWLRLPHVDAVHISRLRRFNHRTLSQLLLSSLSQTFLKTQGMGSRAHCGPNACPICPC